MRSLWTKATPIFRTPEIRVDSLMENSKKGKRYDKQFKEDALATLSHSGKPLSQIARELGIAGVTLWKWKQEYLASLGPAKNAAGQTLPASDLERQNQQLRRDLERLRTHHEILKKALGILSEQNLPKGMPSFNP
jgi:transposase